MCRDSCRSAPRQWGADAVNSPVVVAGHKGRDTGLLSARGAAGPVGQFHRPGPSCLGITGRNNQWPVRCQAIPGREPPRYREMMWRTPDLDLERVARPHDRKIKCLAKHIMRTSGRCKCKACRKDCDCFLRCKQCKNPQVFCLTVELCTVRFRMVNGFSHDFRRKVAPSEGYRMRRPVPGTVCK